ncbi:putative nitroreductase MJ1384 [Candidatus Magnetomoraceae bacterium gMMP-15]
MDSWKPQPRIEKNFSLEETIKRRRTVRSFASKKLTLKHLSQLLWAAQGITDNMGFKRAAPSGGALYPMDIYAVAGTDSVDGLKAGVWHYEPKAHKISLVIEGDLRNKLAQASLSQMWMSEPPLNLVITAEYNRITIKYGQSGIRYAMIEAGHIGQNIFLMSEAQGLKAGIVGAFDDEDVIRILKLPRSHEPLLIMPVGYKKHLINFF